MVFCFKYSSKIIIQGICRLLGAGGGGGGGGVVDTSPFDINNLDTTDLVFDCFLT